MVRLRISKRYKTSWMFEIMLMHSVFDVLCGSLFFYSTVIASNILLVDEIMRAGMSSLKG